MVEIKENYPAEYPHYQPVGDEDGIYIYTEWLAERLSKAVFDMLKTPPDKLSIWRAQEIKI